MKSSRPLLLLSLIGAALGLCLSLVFVLARGSSSGFTARDPFFGPFADIFGALVSGASAVIGVVTVVVATLVGAVLGLGIGLFLTRPRARLPLLIATLAIAGLAVWKMLAPQSTDSSQPVSPADRSYVPRDNAPPSSSPERHLPETASTPARAEPTIEPRRRMEQDAEALLGAWRYPNAEFVSYPNRPGDLTYPTLSYRARDDFQTVADYYQHLVPGGTRSEKVYRAEGVRPGDNRPAAVKVYEVPEGVYIRVDVQ
jgi:hypothetical protein